MKIYFSGSIRGGRKDVLIYEEIISFLKTKCSVLSEHVGNIDLNEEENDVEIFARDVCLIQQCDIIVGECTVPSLGVGYELALAEYLKKRVIVLFRKNNKNRLSAMINGNQNFDKIVYSDIDMLKSKLELLLFNNGF